MDTIQQKILQKFAESPTLMPEGEFAVRTGGWGRLYNKTIVVNVQHLANHTQGVKICEKPTYKQVK